MFSGHIQLIQDSAPYVWNPAISRSSRNSCSRDAGGQIPVAGDQAEATRAKWNQG